MKSNKSSPYEILNIIRLAATEGEGNNNKETVERKTKTSRSMKYYDMKRYGLNRENLVDGTADDGLESKEVVAENRKKCVAMLMNVRIIFRDVVH